jgi:hypothetical protein
VEGVGNFTSVAAVRSRLHHPGNPIGQGGAARTCGASSQGVRGAVHAPRSRGVACHIAGSVARQLTRLPSVAGVTPLVRAGGQTAGGAT